jgi:hypothetical protein
MAATGDWERCIFCGATLMLETVSHWRSVYHPYSYADALLAQATLQAHGLHARHQHSNLERILMGKGGGVIEVAEGDHLFAQEVLRQLRGVRTDTEYREWQEYRHRRPGFRRALLTAVVAATATAALGAAAVWALIPDGKPGARQTERAQR